jgi:hypothetical protein
MRRAAKKVTYANVIASLALFLMLTGGTVWAAGKITSNQIGKGAVKSKNLSKNAVKARNLARNSVTATKLAKNAVSGAKLRNGAVSFAKLAAGTNVIATATAGPIALGAEKPPLPLNTPLVLTAVAGQLTTLNVELRGHLVEPAKGTCMVVTVPLVNGNPVLIGQFLQLSSGEGPGSEFPNGVPIGDVSFPVGLTEPGKPQTVTMQVLATSKECAADSTIEASLVATRVK